MSQAFACKTSARHTVVHLRILKIKSAKTWNCLSKLLEQLPSNTHFKPHYESQKSTTAYRVSAKLVILHGETQVRPQ